MPIAFFLPAATPPARDVELSKRQLGRDFRFTDDYEVGPNGDYLLVEGVDAATQSVVNELRTLPHEIPANDDYGAGTQVYAPATASRLAEVKGRALARCQVNPRLQSVQAVDAIYDRATNRVIVSVVATAAGIVLTASAPAPSQRGGTP